MSVGQRRGRQRRQRRIGRGLGDQEHRRGRPARPAPRPWRRRRGAYQSVRRESFWRRDEAGARRACAARPSTATGARRPASTAGAADDACRRRSRGRPGSCGSGRWQPRQAEISRAADLAVAQAVELAGRARVARPGQSTRDAGEVDVGAGASRVQHRARAARPARSAGRRPGPAGLPSTSAAAAARRPGRSGSRGRWPRRASGRAGSAAAAARLRRQSLAALREALFMNWAASISALERAAAGPGR